MKAQEVKYLREDNAVAKQFFKLLGPAAREAMTVEDISVLVGLAAEVRERHSIPAAVHDAQQAALAAAEEALNYDVDPKYGSIAFSGSHQVEIQAKKVAALAQLRAKEAE